MPRITFLRLAAAAVPLLHAAQAFFRLPCKAPLGYARLDPIVNAGAVAAHEHTIMGGNAFNATMTYADTQTSTCSTCMVKQDRSNYWTPTLWYAHRNGSLSPLEQAGGVLVYYLQREDPEDPEYGGGDGGDGGYSGQGQHGHGLVAFPEGFRMVAGDPGLRTYDDSAPAQRAVRFSCIGVDGPSTAGIPAHACPGGLRAEVVFPSCWDGVRTDSEDHRGHVAYPARVDSGPCPASHPRRLVTLFYEVLFGVQPLPGGAGWWEGPNGDGHPLVVSTGDTTGYSWHGDFFNGWQTDVLQRAIDECRDGSGVIERCAAFEFWDDDTNAGCRMAQTVDGDPPRGGGTSTSDKLPGCNRIGGGKGGGDGGGGDCDDAARLIPPAYPFTDATAHGFAYVGCATDPAGQARTLTGASTAGDDMTVGSCVAFCRAGGWPYAGLEFGRECFCGDAVAADRMPRTDGVWGGCDVVCAGDGRGLCGGAARLSLYRACEGAERGGCVNAAVVM